MKKINLLIPLCLIFSSCETIQYNMIGDKVPLLKHYTVCVDEFEIEDSFQYMKKDQTISTYTENNKKFVVVTVSVATDVALEKNYQFRQTDFKLDGNKAFEDYTWLDSWIHPDEVKTFNVCFSVSSSYNPKKKHFVEFDFSLGLNNGVEILLQSRE